MQQATELLDCGHVPDEGAPANVNGQTEQGWTFVALDDGRKVCHACADKRVLSCGHTPSPHNIYTTGTAWTMDGREICWVCADAEQVADLLKREPVVGYLSADGKAVTTWTGGKLGSVTWSRATKLTRQSYTHNRNSYRTVNMRDVHGNYWTGRGSPGIAIRLRPMKAPK